MGRLKDVAYLFCVLLPCGEIFHRIKHVKNYIFLFMKPGNRAFNQVFLYQIQGLQGSVQECGSVILTAIKVDRPFCSWEWMFKIECWDILMSLWDSVLGTFYFPRNFWNKSHVFLNSIYELRSQWSLLLIITNYALIARSMWLLVNIYFSTVKLTFMTLQ